MVYNCKETNPIIPAVVVAIEGVIFPDIVLTLYISQFSILKFVALKFEAAYKNSICPFELSSFSNSSILKILEISIKLGSFILYASSFIFS